MALSRKERNSKIIKEQAALQGFDFCGIARAEKLNDEEKKLENWLKQGMHGEMAYMENHFDKRLDPAKLVPGARSVVSFIYNYYPGKKLAAENNYKIAKYAYGTDYHFVIKKKLKLMLGELRKEIGDFEGRIFVDSAPVMERQWAAKSGLGWIGKNSLLLNRNMGSFFFLAVMISDLELIPDGPIKDYCGTCTRCMDACPTDAIPMPYVVDGSRCISYFTIELKNEIPVDYQEKFENWIFGCDICQDVCPWNKFSNPNNENEFKPSKNLSNMNKNDWEELSEDTFQKLFRKSAVKRTGFGGLTRNISFVAKE
jgi:epoxyqueuosine reductase